MSTYVCDAQLAAALLFLHNSLPADPPRSHPATRGILRQVCLLTNAKLCLEVLLQVVVSRGMLLCCNISTRTYPYASSGFAAGALPCLASRTASTALPCHQHICACIIRPYRHAVLCSPDLIRLVLQVHRQMQGCDPDTLGASECERQTLDMHKVGCLAHMGANYC